MSVPFNSTPHGFRWGPIEVQRTAEIDGRIVIRAFGVDLDGQRTGQELEVYASPKGRSLRVWKNRKEIK